MTMTRQLAFSALVCVLFLPASQTQVLLTLVGGRTVYQAPSWIAAAERRSEEAVR